MAVPGDSRPGKLRRQKGHRWSARATLSLTARCPDCQTQRRFITRAWDLGDLDADFGPGDQFPSGLEGCAGGFSRVDLIDGEIYGAPRCEHCRRAVRAVWQVRERCIVQAEVVGWEVPTWEGPHLEGA